MPQASRVLPDQFKQFLAKETVCSLGVVLPSGEVHGAPLLFWCDPTTLFVYMSTSKNTEKMTWKRQGYEIAKASIAIGVGKNQPYLLQMRGTIQVLDHRTNERVYTEYMRVAHAKDNPDEADNTMIVFSPTWARYSDWSTSVVTEITI